MIIVEGPDGSGKSTTVERLGRQFGLSTLAKAVSSNTDRAIDPQTYLMEVLSDATVTRPWLLDRFWLISGSVYGAALGSGSKHSDTNSEMDNGDWLAGFWGKFAARVEQRQVFTVWCLPPLGVVLKNLRDDETTPLFVKDRISLIYRLYHGMAYRAYGSYPDVNYVHDYTRPSSHNHLEIFMRKALMAHSLSHMPKRRAGGGVEGG